MGKHLPFKSEGLSSDLQDPRKKVGMWGPGQPGQNMGPRLHSCPQEAPGSNHKLTPPREGQHLKERT